MSRLLLDTHTFIWFVVGSDELGRSSQKIITKALNDNQGYLAAISLWEIAMLDKKQRIILEMPCLEWINQSIKLTHIHVLPLSPAIATESAQLPGNFHGDPADSLIAATARVESCTLVTRDKKLLAYSKENYLSAIKI